MWCKSLEVLNPHEALKEANMHDLKLRECPFCGGKAELFHSYDGYHCVQCTCCACGTIHVRTERAAIRMWNRRAGEEGKNEAD